MGEYIQVHYRQIRKKTENGLSHFDADEFVSLINTMAQDRVTA